MTVAGSTFASAINEITRMGQLVHNWDGHGAHAAPPAACGQAARFLHRVEAKFGYQVPSPHVGAVPGGIVMVWRRSGRNKQGEGLERELEIVFTERGNEWSASERNSLEPTMSGEDVDLDTLLKVIDRFIVS